ncbi:MAG: hypothetical protein MUE52_16600 [Tabrizicola sp.]|jgi:hypothetical protein|nr:hypothetical protein [Tabrizicola sp.]
MTAQSFETLTRTTWLPSRLLRALPVIGRVIRYIERDVDTVFYLLVIVVTALVLAVQAWGIAALVVSAVAFVPVMFTLLIWITLP